MSTIDRCGDFYKDCVAPMIHNSFADYEGRVAAGVAGEGSECWGYDDDYSQDHDFAISVCLWLTDEDFEVIGPDLDNAYRQLCAGQAQGSRLDYRRGVQRISDFYANMLGFTFDTATPSLTDGQWFYAEDIKISAAVNGKVFRDDLGAFSRVRRLLQDYYPERIYRMKLANALHGYAAAIQANYPRCMGRGEYVAAHTCISRGMEEAIRIAFMLQKRYMPYYKWSHRGLRELCEETGTADADKAALKRLADLIEELAVTEVQTAAWRDFGYSSSKVNMNDNVVELSEEIAGVLAGMLYDRGLTDNHETFLEAHCASVAKGIQ